jgi:hypothetical protein
MALGVTGIIRPSTVDLADMEVLYSFTSDRITQPSDFLQLDVNQVISKRFLSTGSKQVLQGMYTLKLPAAVFTGIGYYTLLIRPKQITTTILDCGVLSQLPDQKGIVLDANTRELQALAEKLNPGGLSGFRVEYINSDDNSIIPNLFSTIAYSNRCEAISQVSDSSTQRSVVYRFNDNGSLLFLSVTPASSPSIKPNAFPYIGVAGQKIIMSNTYFDTQVIDIEITEYNLRKIALLINGERTLNIDTGIENIYDEGRNILTQSTLYDIKDEVGNPLYKVKTNNLPTEINTSETWDTINDGVL